MRHTQPTACARYQTTTPVLPYTIPSSLLAAGLDGKSPVFVRNGEYISLNIYYQHRDKEV